MNLNNYSLDAKDLLTKLSIHYSIEINNEMDLKTIQKKLKLDIKKVESFNNLLRVVKYPLFEFLCGANEIFPKLFSNKVLEKVIVVLAQMNNEPIGKRDVHPTRIIRNMAQRDKFI